MARLIKAIWANKFVYLFLVPLLVPIIIFGYLPAVQAFSLSIISERGKFTGLENFFLLVTDNILSKSTLNMVYLLLAGMATANIPAFIMAELLYGIRSKRISSMYRFLFIIPMMIPGTVIMLLWRYLMLDPMNGLINAVLIRFGIAPLGWLGEVKTALPGLMLIGFPWVAGTNLLIYLAGIQNIPESVIESATLDGAKILRRIFMIDIPLLLGQIKLLLVLGIIGGIQGFQLQYMTTNGDPAYATMVPGLWMYRRAFQFNDFEYGSTIGVVMFLVILFFSYLNIKFIQTDNT
ncbi:MAG: sugar ABC transporter permease [Treponema sp.]|jgi:raffinose/stachyose/melibiose transport system permease protein|nr:sugar ABC transporter permease [Treponema sp.]